MWWNLCLLVYAYCESFDMLKNVVVLLLSYDGQCLRYLQQTLSIPAKPPVLRDSHKLPAVTHYMYVNCVVVFQ